MVRSTHPGFTPAAAPPPGGLDRRHQQVAAGQPDLESRVAATVDRRLARRVSGRREQGEVRLPEAAEHFANHGAQLAGRRSRDRARPQLGAHGVPVDAVHLRIEVRVADDRPRRVEGVGRRLGASDGRPDSRDHEHD